MKVEASAERTINEAGNQVLMIAGLAIPSAQQGVLPADKRYVGKFVELYERGGSVYFKFEVEATGPAAESKPLPTELTPQQQEDAFLRSQLKNPDLDPVSRHNILEKLSGPEESDNGGEA